MSEVEELQRELRGVQEMLAFVLNETGPVVVPKEKMTTGLPNGAQIRIEDDRAKDAFVFDLVEETDGE